MNEADPHAVQLIAEFEFTPAEMREAIRAVARQGLGKRYTAGRIGWILCGVLAILLFVFLRVQHSAVFPPPSTAIAPQPRTPLLNLVLLMLPWVIIFGFVPFLGFWLRRKALKNSPLLNRRWKLVADDHDLVMSQPYERTERAWEAFIQFGQTGNLFLLFRGKLLALPIPKRAFANPYEADAFQRLAQSRISPRISAFPVLPAKQPENQLEPPA